MHATDSTPWFPLGSLERVDAEIQRYDEVAEELVQAAEAWHALEERMPAEKEAAILRLMARHPALSYSAADKAAGTDETYNGLRAQRREIEARKLRLANHVESARMRYEWAQECFVQQGRVRMLADTLTTNEAR